MLIAPSAVPNMAYYMQEYQVQYPHLSQCKRMLTLLRALARQEIGTQMGRLTELATFQSIEAQKKWFAAAESLVSGLGGGALLEMAVSEALYFDFHANESHLLFSKGDQRERQIAFISTLSSAILFGLLNFNNFCVPLHWLHWLSMGVVPIEVSAGALMLEPLGKYKFLGHLSSMKKGGIASITAVTTLASAAGAIIDGVFDPSPVGMNIGLISGCLFAGAMLLRLGWVIRDLMVLYQQKSAIQILIKGKEMEALRYQLPSAEDPFLRERKRAKLRTEINVLQKTHQMLDRKMKSQWITTLSTGLLVGAVIVALVIPHIAAVGLAVVLAMKVSLLVANVACSVLTSVSAYYAKGKQDMAIKKKIEAVPPPLFQHIREGSRQRSLSRCSQAS